MKLKILIVLFLLFLSACASRQVEKPLIKTDEFLAQAKKDIDETVKLGPKAVIETDEFKKAQENKEPIDDSYNPDAKPQIIKEDGDLNKPDMEKVSDIDVEKI